MYKAANIDTDKALKIIEAFRREEILLKAKPILFNTDMIRAILDGRKTVTRRVLKNQDPNRIFNFDYVLDKNSVIYAVDLYCDNGNNGYWTLENKAPYFEGDILYVRETWGISNFDIDEQAVYIVYKAGNEKENCQKIILPKDKIERLYNNYSESEPDWHPSIHMPKEAARIFLRVTDVRVERLQEICTYGVYAEGIPKCSIDPCCVGTCDECLQDNSPIRKFIRLWDSTIKKSDIDKYGWVANPYVWVIEFERID
ncbi:MAG: hypothetical protein NC247_12005 [Ruminococcus flavefaciens]|nr:hypothetical protein [Ruminococcus flavefaciens]MCM1361965.1 hypothetical protein [Clostridiales bacterium]